MIDDSQTITGLKYCTSINENVQSISSTGVPLSCVPGYTLIASSYCQMTDLAYSYLNCMEGCNLCKAITFDAITSLPLTYLCDSCLPKRYMLNSVHVCIAC